MTPRPDALIMGGVIVLGGFVAIKLFSGGGSKAPDPPPPEGGIKPTRSGPFPELPNNVRSLKAGVTYYGRFDFDRPVSRSALVSLLDMIGLKEGVVYERLAEAEANIPRIRYVLDNPGVYTQWFRAKALETRPLVRPAELTYLWIAT